MKDYILETSTTLDAPLEEVFAFFSDAQNLEKLTPKELSFQILTPMPIEMREGALIEYKINLSGVPFKWVTEITDWQPGKQFTDSQLKGPYAKWVHTHSFEAEGNRTKMHDRVEYLPKGWIFAPLITALFVRKKVEEIFGYRNSVLGKFFQK